VEHVFSNGSTQVKESTPERVLKVSNDILDLLQIEELNAIDAVLSCIIAATTVIGFSGQAKLDAIRTLHDVVCSIMQDEEEKVSLD
jgi:hypothetical protein